MSEETDDREILHVDVEAVVADESFLDEDKLLSWDGFRVKYQELWRRRSNSLKDNGILLLFQWSE